MGKLKPVYAGVFLTPASQVDLEGLAIHSSLHAHHCTLWFRNQDRALLASFPWGEEVTLQVTKLVEDTKGQAAGVTLPAWAPAKDFPHVTISCDEGTRPVYSNELGHLEGEACSLTLKGRVGWFSNRGSTHFEAP